MEQSNNTIEAAHQGAVIFVCWFSLGTKMRTIRIPDPKSSSKGLPHSSPGENNRDVNLQTGTQPLNHKLSRGGSPRWDTAWTLLSPCCCMSLPSHAPWWCPGLSGLLCCLSFILHTGLSWLPPRYNPAQFFFFYWCCTSSICSACCLLSFCWVKTAPRGKFSRWFTTLSFVNTELLAAGQTAACLLLCSVIL